MATLRLTGEAIPTAVGPNEEISLHAEVVVSGIPTGHLQLHWDESMATLAEGSALVTLPAGSYKREFTWIMKPTTTEGTVEFRVRAQAGSLVQETLATVHVGSA